MGLLLGATARWGGVLFIFNMRGMVGCAETVGWRPETSWAASETWAKKAHNTCLAVGNSLLRKEKTDKWHGTEFKFLAICLDGIYILRRRTCLFLGVFMFT